MYRTILIWTASFIFSGLIAGKTSFASDVNSSVGATTSISPSIESKSQIMFLVMVRRSVKKREPNVASRDLSTNCEPSCRRNVGQGQRWSQESVRFAVTPGEIKFLTLESTSTSFPSGRRTKRFRMSLQFSVGPQLHPNSSYPSRSFRSVTLIFRRSMISRHAAALQNISWSLPGNWNSSCIRQLRQDASAWYERCDIGCQDAKKGGERYENRNIIFGSLAFHGHAGINEHRDERGWRCLERRADCR